MTTISATCPDCSAVLTTAPVLLPGPGDDAKRYGTAQVDHLGDAGHSLTFVPLDTAGNPIGRGYVTAFMFDAAGGMVSAYKRWIPADDDRPGNPLDVYEEDEDDGYTCPYCGGHVCPDCGCC